MLSAQPINQLAEVGVVKLCLGGRHSLALCADGRIFSWGRDDEGQVRWDDGELGWWPCCLECGMGAGEWVDVLAVHTSKSA